MSKINHVVVYRGTPIFVTNDLVEAKTLYYLIKDYFPNSFECNGEYNGLFKSCELFSKAFLYISSFDNDERIKEVIDGLNFHKKHFGD